MALDKPLLWNCTSEAIKSAEINYHEMPLMHRDGPINGCVFVYPGEIPCFIDDAKMPVLNDIYKYYSAQVYKRLNIVDYTFNQKVFKPLVSIVKKCLPYNKDAVEIFERGLDPKEPVGIDYYIGNRAGICSSEAILGAYLVERLVKDKFIIGKVSLDRNIDPINDGHAWIRYAEKNIYIVDIAGNFSGTLNEAQRKMAWDYRRPDEY